MGDPRTTKISSLTRVTSVKSANPDGQSDRHTSLLERQVTLKIKSGSVSQLKTNIASYLNVLVCLKRIFSNDFEKNV